MVINQEGACDPCILWEVEIQGEFSQKGVWWYDIRLYTTFEFKSYLL